MASEVGSAYVSILPSAAGFASRLQREIGSDLARAGKRGGQEYGKAFEKETVNQADTAASGMSDKLKVGLAAGGVLAGAALIAGVGEALDRGRLEDKLAAQLGGGAKTRRATKVAADLFNGAWGESVEDVNTAVASVVTNIGGMRKATQRELKSVTASVLDIATAFDQDASAITRAADQLVRTNLAKGPREALDIITRGFQAGANEADDLLDTYAEYGTQFRKLGLDGKEATGLLTQGLKAGARDADVVADAFKEFSIRAVDGSELTKDSFDALGLSAADMEDKIGRGGKSAADATDLVLDRLRKVKDPADRAQIAVGLFGTQSEDLGDALFALDPSNAVDTLGKVGGAAKRMGKTLNDNAATQVTEFKRTLQTDFVNFLGDEVIPKASALYDAWKDLPGPLKAASKWLGVIGGVGAGGVFLGSKFIGAIGSAKSALGGFRGTVQSVGTEAASTRGRLGRFGSFLGAGGPWGLALAAGVAGLGFFLKAQADAKEEVKNLTNSLDAQSGAITRNTTKQIINAAQQEGLYAKAAKVGISADQFTRALLGQDDALTAVNRRLRTTIDANSEWQSTGLTSAHVTHGVGREATQLSVALGAQTGKLADARQAWKRNKDQEELANRVLKSTEDLWGKATGATQKNTKATEDQRQQLRKTAEQMGLNQKETRQLIRDYGDVPGKVDTEAIFRTADAARARDKFLSDTKGKFSDLGNETYAIMVNGQSGHGRIFAAGGFVSGPGGPRDDKISARLSNGEFVVNADATRRNRELLESINAKKFADGGIVGRTNTKVNMNLSALRQVVAETLKALQTSAASGGMTSAQVARGLAFARSQVGDPYVWGGVGPNGYDCSGFQSAVFNAARGLNPYHRLGSTGTMPWPHMAPGKGGAYQIGWFTGNPGHTAGTLGGVNVESRGGEGVVVGRNARGADDPLFNRHAHFTTAAGRNIPVSMGRGDPAFTGATGSPNRLERWIIGRESGGRVTANNPSSSAFGLGQLISSNRVAYAKRLGLNWHREMGDTGTTDYGAQLAMMRMYMKDRYGGARGAVNFWQQHGYYDNGGVLKPGFTMAYNGTGRDEYVTKEPPHRRGPQRIVLDAGSIGRLSGWIDDRIDGALDFEAGR